MSRILVVDDKELMRDSVATTLSRKGHTIVAAADADQALAKLAQRSVDAIITDLQMPGRNGLELLAEIRKIDEQIPVVLMTAFGTVENAVEAMKQGAYDYITKPFGGDQLLITVERAIERAQLVRENQILRATQTKPTEMGRGHALIGEAPVMHELRKRMALVADSHGTVLITGESGSGKEVAARCLHDQSPRREQPFLAINCAALSTSLLESELFGHEKGSFTGADKLRKGRFELADGGTLLLDEISEIAPEIQAKLLRVLQEHTFERVGSSTTRAVDVRVMATTNRDLPAEVARGEFRQDLFYRLNVLPLQMPPLREHLVDVPDLVGHFLNEVAQREGRPPQTMEPAAIELLMGYAWPGNVRELQNICERAAVLARTGTIRAAMIRPWLAAAPTLIPGDRKATALIEIAPMSGNGAPPTEPAVVGGAEGGTLPCIVCDGAVTLEQVERETIINTLVHNNGHRQRSAKALGIGVRTLGLKLKKWKDMQIVSETL